MSNEKTVGRDSKATTRVALITARKKLSLDNVTQQ